MNISPLISFNMSSVNRNPHAASKPAALSFKGVEDSFESETSKVSPSLKNELDDKMKQLDKEISGTQKAVSAASEFFLEKLKEEEEKIAPPSAEIFNTFTERAKQTNDVEEVASIVEESEEYFKLNFQEELKEETGNQKKNGLIKIAKEGTTVMVSKIEDLMNFYDVLDEIEKKQYDNDADKNYVKKFVNEAEKKIDKACKEMDDTAFSVLTEAQNAGERYQSTMFKNVEQLNAYFKSIREILEKITNNTPKRDGAFWKMQEYQVCLN